MDRIALLEPFVKLLDTACPPGVVREVEAGGDPAPLWDAIEASGFLDALVPEEQGGAGLMLADIAQILMACGRFAVPLPIGDTIAARALFAMLGEAPPSGAIMLFSGSPAGVAAGALPGPRTHRLRAASGTLHFEPADGSTARHWTGWGEAAVVIDASPAEACRRLGALVRAAGIAGAAAWLLDASAAYAGERVQFGKPIGRQQALQQQLAVMAEQVIAARMAVELGCAGGMPLALAPAATAKIVTSIAAPQVAAIAHAVHGAIGISAEHDLQLYTRRLHSWRVDHGAESYWEHRLGAERIRGGAERSVDWIREAFP